MNVCPECGQTFTEGGFCTQDGTRLSSESDPLIGTILGPYRVVQLIGVGGMGRVYKGVNPTIRSRVAIKVLSHDCLDRPELVDRFFAEARAVNLIRHESIVNVLDLDRLPDGRPYITMEFLDGMPLSRAIAQRGRLPLGTLAQLMAEVLDALAVAHAKGVVHRDLKPDNIYVTQQGRAKILDFGIAKLVTADWNEVGPTRAGSLLGTPHYMAPEQALSRAVDPRTDLYAAGVILYEAATGQRPFESGAVFAILRMQVEDTPVPPGHLRPELPAAYQDVILRAMAKQPADRFATAVDMAGALRTAARDLPLEAWQSLDGRATRDSLGPPTPVLPTGRPTPTPVRRGRPWLIVAGGLLLAGAATAALVLASQSHDAPVEHAPAAAVAGPDAPGSPTAPPATPPTSTTSPSATADPGSAGPGEPTRPTHSSAHAGSANTATGLPVTKATNPPRATDPDHPAGSPATSSHTAVAQNQHGTQPPASSAGSTHTTSATQATGATSSKTASSSSHSAVIRRTLPNPHPHAWNVSSYLPRARALARAQFPDAVLLRFDAQGVRPSGRADLTLDSRFSVLYRFVSPSHVGRPHNLPAGVSHRGTCIYYVVVEKDSVSTYPLTNWPCDHQPSVRRPRCTLKQVWQKAAGKGAPTHNAVAEIDYRLGPDGQPHWWFQIGKDYQYTFDDDC